jgi:predicted ester cyclase
MSASAEEVARRYFAAIARHDLDAAVACWRPGAIDRLAPVGELRAPDGLRAYFSAVFAAMPDFSYELLDVVAEGDKVAVRWRVSATFDGGPYQGIRATGAKMATEGADVLRVEDGLIVRNDSYWDDADVGRQIGLLPPRGSRAERILRGLFNARTALRRGIFRRGEA